MSDADIEQMHSDGSDKGIEKAPPTEQEKIDLQHQEEYKNGGSIDPYIFYKYIPSPEILPRRVKYFKEVEEIIENSIARYKPEQNPEDAQNPLAPNKKDVGKAKQSYIESVLVRKATQQGGAISREQEQIIREQVREIFNEMCDRSYFFKVHYGAYS